MTTGVRTISTAVTSPRRKPRFRDLKEDLKEEFREEVSALLEGLTKEEIIEWLDSFFDAQLRVAS